jgi:hypothetical protein
MSGAPGAQAARDRLHDAVRAAYLRTATCGSALAQVMQAAARQQDLTAYYAETARCIIALEDLHKAAERAARDARSSLLLSMLDTGCPEVRDPAFIVYLQREPSFIEILDETKIPPDLWTRPKPEPDRKLIKAALDNGRQVPGASLNVRNIQRLVIRGKNDGR